MILGFDPRYQFVHEDDVVHALEHVVQRELPGRLQRGRRRRAGADRGRGPARQALRADPAAVGHRASRPAWRAGSGSEIPPEMLNQLRFGRGVDNRRLKAAGFEYGYTSREAVLALGEHLRLHPLLRGDGEPYRYEREVEEFLRWSPHVRRSVDGARAARFDSDRRPLPHAARPRSRPPEPARAAGRPAGRPLRRPRLRGDHLPAGVARAAGPGGSAGVRAHSRGSRARARRHRFGARQGIRIATWRVVARNRATCALVKRGETVPIFGRRASGTPARAYPWAPSHSSPSRRSCSRSWPARRPSTPTTPPTRTRSRTASASPACRSAGSTRTRRARSCAASCRRRSRSRSWSSTARSASPSRPRTPA